MGQVKVQKPGATSEISMEIDNALVTEAKFIRMDDDGHRHYSIEGIVPNVTGYQFLLLIIGTGGSTTVVSYQLMRVEKDGYSRVVDDTSDYRYGITFTPGYPGHSTGYPMFNFWSSPSPPGEIAFRYGEESDKYRILIFTKR